MSPYTLLTGVNGQTFRFRRPHPTEAFAGTAGVVALLKVHFFDTTTVLYVAACNDLGPFEAGVIEQTPIFRQARKLGCNAVALMKTGTASSAKREAIAASIQWAHEPPLNVDEAA
ncbi:hypothetical protein H7F50_16905 [Novosphingobium flavum]|nr:hypothetical protein [Novosphingobium aerophilum]